MPEPTHSFDFPLGDLSPAQQASLDAALQREHIDHQWSGSTLQVDIAYEARVGTLVDQARGGALPAAHPPPGPPPGAPISGTVLAGPAPVAGAPGYPPAPGYATTAYGQPAYGYPVYAAPRTNGLAIASLICGICSIVFCFGPLLGIPAIVTGHLARKQIRESDVEQQGEGMAMAGLVTGYLSTALTVIGIIFYVVIIAAAVSSSSKY